MSIRPKIVSSWVCSMVDERYARYLIIIVPLELIIGPQGAQILILVRIERLEVHSVVLGAGTCHERHGPYQHFCPHCVALCVLCAMGGAGTGGEGKGWTGAGDWAGAGACLATRARASIPTHSDPGRGPGRPGSGRHHHSLLKKIPEFIFRHGLDRTFRRVF